VLVLAWSYAARDLLPLARREPWPAEIQKRAPPLARYDSGWYLAILERGYGPPPAPGQVSPHAFFPLYPLLARGVASLLGMDGFVAGQVLSIACFLAAGLLFAAEGRRRLGARRSRDALLFLLLYPTAFFLVAMYSESLFLLLALAAFGQARRDRPAAAAVLGLLAGTTRLTALALAVPLAIEAFSAARTAERPALSDGRAWRRSLLAGLAPAAGVFLWAFGSGLAAGEPGLFFQVQEAWQRGTSPLLGAWHFVKLPLARIAHGQALDHPALFLDYGHFLLFAAIGVYQARRRRFSDAAWTAGALLIPITSGISASLSRYVLVVYPAFYALAEVFQDRPRLRVAWWIGSGALLLAAEAAFVHWRWVA
jgi:Mannosyltransferase (PIG-V)